MKNTLISIATKAAAAIMPYYMTSTSVEYKQDNSPLTAADLASEKTIHEGLKEAFPDIPIISEEGQQNLQPAMKRYFLVDPLDGTKDFLNQNGQFVVSIGLIENGYPVCGVLHQPATNTIYTAFDNIAEKHQGKVRQVIQVREAGRELTMLGSNHAEARQFPEEFEEKLKPITTIESVGSALKFAVIAEGKADIYPRLDPLKVWDTAAGQAIVEAAGGKVIDTQENRLKYTKLTHDGFVVFGSKIFI